MSYFTHDIYRVTPSSYLLAFSSSYHDFIARLNPPYHDYCPLNQPGKHVSEQ